MPSTPKTPPASSGPATEATAGTAHPDKSATHAKGQKVSQERGTATHHKKNPGKRPHQGGGAR